jgi:outer membrane receptor protein involved in Fe transport
MRGVASIYGLAFIPGPWMESIQVVKGSGSVVNGYESTTGQINVEFKKPHEKETPRFYLNLYGAESTNTELNTFFKHTLTNKWSTILMAHGNYFNKNIDSNQDGFNDMPHKRQINFYNRWQYDNGKNREAQIGFKYLNDNIHGGQSHAGKDADVDVTKYYVTSVITNRAEAFGKLGFVFPEKPGKSIGNILQVTYYDMQSEFGLKNFSGEQKSLYYQSIYQNIIGNTNHQYKFGWAYHYDNYEEVYLGNHSTKNESVPGVFSEYTFSHLEKFTAVAGVREDYHNEYKWIFTPRLHLKYNFTESFIVRASAGKSFRVPYLIADNISVLASSRRLFFPETILPERAWNYGINFTKKFKLKAHEGSLNLDLYKTDFINQLVVDQYSNPDTISFYNLYGTSYSNSFQVTLSYELIKKLDLRFAYKMDDVKETFNGALEEKPLVPKERALMNLAYSTPNDHWKFDYTLVREGEKKLASTAADPVHGKLPSLSPEFFTMNFQFTKVFRRFDVYAGLENILDYRQQHPIIAANDPFGNSFDATQVWGPIEGRRIYAGLRFSID